MWRNISKTAEIAMNDCSWRVNDMRCLTINGSKMSAVITDRKRRRVNGPISPRVSLEIGATTPQIR
jgi:hypothetical protein